MTSKEIKDQVGYEYTKEYWLKEITYQLAVMNENNKTLCISSCKYLSEIKRYPIR